MGRTSHAKSKLVQTARMLFWEKGYTAVSTEEICQKSGVNKGSLYYFFPTKQALLMAVMEVNWEAVKSGIQDAEARSRNNHGLAVIDKFFEGLFEGSCWLQTKTGSVLGCPVGTLVGELAPGHPDVQRKITEVFDYWTSFYEKEILEAIKKGELPAKTNAKRAAQALFAYTQGVLLVARAVNDPQVVRTMAKNVTKIIAAA